MKTFIIIALILSLSFNLEAATISLGLGGTRVSKEVNSLKYIKTRNIVPQTLDYSCGPAALATLLSYYFEDKVTEDDVIKFLLLTGDLNKIKARKGFSLLDLKNFAKYKGYEVTGYKMDLDFLVKSDKPILVPVNIKDYSHFIVFLGQRGNRVFLADPALGRITMPPDRFTKIWQGGIGLVLTKAGEENLNSPLKLSEDEEAVVAGSGQIKNLLGTNSLGQIYHQGEF